MQQHQSHWEESWSSTAVPILFSDMRISLPWYPVLRCFYVIRYFITWEMHYFTIASKHAVKSILTENWYPCEKERNERNNVITKWGWKNDKLFMKWLIVLKKPPKGTKYSEHILFTWNTAWGKNGKRRWGTFFKC